MFIINDDLQTLTQDSGFLPSDYDVLKQYPSYTARGTWFPDDAVEPLHRTRSYSQETSSYSYVNEEGTWIVVTYPITFQILSASPDAPVMPPVETPTDATPEPATDTTTTPEV